MQAFLVQHVEYQLSKDQDSLLIGTAADRFRSSDGPIEKWTRLLNPAIQFQLMWQRIKDRDFHYGENSGFARLSLIRLVINPWTLILATAALGWTLWQDARQAQEIVDAFHQGPGHSKEEYDALWRLAASRSTRTVRAVFADFLSTQDGASKFMEHSEAIQASVGLRTSSLDAVRSAIETGPCATPSGAYIVACVTIAKFSGEEQRLADRIVELLAKTYVGQAGELGEALAALAPHVKGDQAVRLADRIVELLGKADVEQAGDLGKALAALAPHVKGDQAERGANRIVELLSKAEVGQVGDLSEALAALAPHVKGDQAERGAYRIVELLSNTVVIYPRRQLRRVNLATLVKGDQATRLADHI
jgi:hypothetical protein